MTHLFPNPSIIVQTLSVYWGKNGRGGERAEYRSRLPKAVVFPIPEMDEDHNTIIHSVDWNVWDNASNAPQSRSLPGRVSDRWYTIGSIQLKRSDDRLEVEWTGWDSGKPNRCYPNSRKDSFTINDGQWAQIRWNGRFTELYSGFWSYRSVTANIAFSLSHRPESGLFLNSSPTIELDRMARLF